jgi:hypothetical protein
MSDHRAASCAPTAVVSDEFNPEIAADSTCRSAQGLQGNRRISWGEESIERCAAGLHPAGHFLPSIDDSM